jgi:hypothetical protein
MCRCCTPFLDGKRVPRGIEKTRGFWSSASGFCLRQRLLASLQNDSTEWQATWPFAAAFPEARTARTTRLRLEALAPGSSLMNVCLHIPRAWRMSRWMICRGDVRSRDDNLAYALSDERGFGTCLALLAWALTGQAQRAQIRTCGTGTGTQ